MGERQTETERQKEGEREIQGSLWDGLPREVLLELEIARREMLAVTGTRQEAHLAQGTASAHTQGGCEAP